MKKELKKAVKKEVIKRPLCKLLNEMITLASQIEIRNHIVELLKDRPRTRYEIQQITEYSFYSIKNQLRWLEQLKVVKRKQAKIGKITKDMWCYVSQHNR